MNEISDNGGPQDAGERLLLITLELASKQGLDNTSLSDIAARAGIRKASLYYHFPSREKLIERMFAYCTGLASIQEATISFKGTAQEVLSRAMEHWHRLYTTAPLSYFYRIVEEQKLILPIAATTSEMFAHMLRGQSEVLLETLNETGRLDIEELDLAVTMFTNTVQAFLTRSMVRKDDEDIEWEEERFIRRFCSLYTGDHKVTAR
ncbi:MAG: TetR/AcrR family transcriptional regulator [Sphaerochaetaceae bacterium]|jgi:AcrR family transcriptional regulator